MDTTQLLKGVLDLAVLAVLRDEDGYGYDILRRLRSAGLDEVGDASVYGTLRRLFQAGMLTTYVVPSESGPHRKYYALNAAGRTQLGASGKVWRGFATTMDQLIGGDVVTESVPLGATIEVDYYYERVAAALADLPPEARDELLEDLQAHFVEVLAEQGGPLVDRLGPPAMYAAELRAAAGLEAGAVRAADRAPIVVYYERFVAALPELDRRAGRIIGYPKATEFLRLLRPAWWIARAVAIVVLIFATDIVPADRFDDPIGWLFLAVATVVSIRIGATGAPRVPRWIGFAGTAVAVVGVLFVIANAPSLLRQYTSDAYYASSGGGPFDGVTNVFPVDEQGRSLQHITLYDQNGNAIQVGDYWRCTSGEGAVASYPLCLGIARPTPTVTAEPTDAPAPTATPSPGASASPSPGATVSPGGSPGGGPSLSPSANPSVSPSR